MSEPWWPPVFMAEYKRRGGYARKATYSGPYGLVIVHQINDDNFTVTFCPADAQLRRMTTTRDVTRLELRALLRRLHTEGTFDGEG